MYTDDTTSTTEGTAVAASSQTTGTAASQVEFCTNCASRMDPNSAVCGSCSVPRLVARHHCWHCASSIQAEDALCMTCGAGLHGDSGRAGNNGTIGSKRIVAAALAFFCGAFGVHRFYLGDTSGGLIRLAISVLLCIFTLGFSMIAMSVIGIVECVIYVTNSDADFIRTYQVGNRRWF